MIKAKNIYIDMDNTICYTNGTFYDKSIPNYDKINIVNSLYENNNITIWTARGTVSGIDYYDLCEKQLDSWGVKYHKLLLGKPAFDILIDDKAFNSLDTIQNINNI